MGFISRKIFPACGSMCVCCPALRSRSRQPVKRYKKLLSEIFPKSPDAPPNERKIAKLCEYAAKNPFRIPKIAKYLEERCYKELRHEHIKFINIVTEAYHKLLCMCKEQMAYFAVNLLNVVGELLDNSKQDAMRILGCQTLTKFIYSQADGTYTHNIEKFVPKVCKLLREDGEEHQRRCLRASSLQCLSAMVWFMAQYSYIFATLDEMVHATLDNYELDTHAGDDNERGEPHHNWVDEVVRCEGRGAIVARDASPSNMIIRPQPEKKDPSLLTREETETPKVWAQICIQRMVELAKESTTLRQILDPMFVYFDSRQHWVSQQGLAMVVLSDMSYWEASGNQQLILAAVIRHLDHKNVAHDPQLKSYIVQVAAALARQIRSRGVLAEIGFVSDLCRHLRKSFQANLESVGEQELDLNILLQNSIEDCLLEIAKGIDDAQTLFNMMAISLEKLPSSGVVARATIGSLMILAHMISLALVSSRLQQVFPEALLVQLMKAMLHPNVEARVGAHQIFSALLIPSSNRPRHEVASMRSGYVYEPRRWRSNNASAFSSISALLEKLRREKDGIKMEKNSYCSHDDLKGKDNVEEDWKQGHVLKSSPNIYSITSIIDRTAAPNMVEAEPYIMKLTEDQIMQLLSAFWIQATLPDNLPSNIEAISHSFVLTLISLRLKNINDSLVVRFFQLPLSLKNISLDPSNGMLTPALQRSIFMLSMGMLMFAAKIHQIPDLNDLIKSIVPFDADPYLGISEDLQVFVRPQADVRGYGSVTDNQLASSLLMELRDKLDESNKVMMDILVQNLSTVTELEIDDLTKQLFEPFTPDDAFMFGPRSILDLDHDEMISQSKESLSFDEDVQTSSLLEDDARSEASVLDLSRFIPKVPASPSISHVISIGQLLESALEVAGQVAATSVSTSPLPFDTMASRCEAFGTGTRKKLSNWLAHENHQNGAADKFLPAVLADDRHMTLRKITSEGAFNGPVSRLDPCLAMRLPPASPFDNFLKAAGC
ncbi:PREDICTED: protein EFR3 homolog B [Theobroma cacao]|uniref:Protein EFR3 homolog B n=1 Tax=Theobroma cacao TaxID=3641 RepID=A0AB32V5H2_THECC|nr:PREDICTED: protein EFR3 homolog B [Theobroma cacao]XP_017977417.1 PREDICTED: protein EFR3 homolog B [Theobroma cacao]